jgi:hypothetical protein
MAAREIARLDLIALRLNDPALDQIFKFADVAWALIRLEKVRSPRYGRPIFASTIFASAAFANAILATASFPSATNATPIIVDNPV